MSGMATGKLIGYHGCSHYRSLVMNEAVEQKKTKDRSPNFPFINLERAIERARLFYAQEKRGVAPYSRAVLHWNYSESSSAALQTVSALKSYGLLQEASGSGRGRQLQLSDLALRILLDQRPDSHERLKYVREAARAPAVAADIYDKWPESLPSDSTLSHYLVLERRFNEATAPSVIRIIKENQELAKLSDEPSLSETGEIAEKPVVEALRGPTVHGEREEGSNSQLPHLPGTSAGRVGGVVALQPDRAHIEQHLLRNGMKITLHFSGQPTADVYHALARLMKFKGEDFDAQEESPA